MKLTELSQTDKTSNENRKLTVKDIDKVRHIEGFPIAEDEDIIALSDPPYYTACPNPFLQEFIEKHGKPYDPATDDYHREPFAADVSEGKNDPIYNAHSYHTKVPHKAIMRYILHYTDPGDIVYDGFCGTGMTGVAAQMCGNPDPEFKFQIEMEMPGVKWGTRKAILCDLSPAATFIAYNYNTPVDVEAFEREAKRILDQVEAECGWMYETWHTPPSPSKGEGPGVRVKGRINYTVWSDVFICSECAEEIVYWEAAVDHDTKKVLKTFQCPRCNASLTRTNLDRATETVFDDVLNTTITRAKQVPVLIIYSVEEGSKTKRYEKKPDADDLALIEKIENMSVPYWFPTDKIPEGDKTQDPIRLGITHVHHFHNKRNLWVLSALRSRALSGALLVVFQSIVSRLCSKLVVYSLGKRGNVSLSGTLYIPSLVAEAEVLKVFKSKFRTFLKVFRLIHTSGNLSTVQSSSQLLLESDNVDYIFTDPPFGCLPAGTKIITANGYKPIEEIQAGDRVLSHKGRFCRVIRTFRRHHRGRMMKIQVAYTNEQLHITPNHRMRVIRTVDCNYNFKYCRPSCTHLLQANYTCTHFDNYALSWTPAGEIKPYDVLFVPSFSEEIENPKEIDLSNELPDYYADGEFLYYEKLRKDTLQIRAALTSPNFEYAHGKIKDVAEELSQPYHVVSRIWNTEIKRNRSPQYKMKQIFPLNEDFARLVGYFVADGSTDVRSDGGTLYFHFHVDETAYREDISGIMRRIFDLTGREVAHPKMGKQCVLTFYSKPLAEYFRKTFGKNALTKSLPEWFLRLPDEFLIEFIRGYLRGDGCVTGNAYTFSTSSPSLAAQVRMILQRLNIPCRTWTAAPTTSRIRNRTINVGTSYTLFVTGKGIERLSTLLKETHPFISQRKKTHNEGFWWQEGDEKGLCLPIKNVEFYEYDGEVYNLETEDQSYTTIHGCVHNSNLMYSELNFLWEAWLRVKTNNKPEAIENKTQGKSLLDYQRLMEGCFHENYRILKPGRWMTLEFHNSKNSVWSAIQEAILRAGFVVADVRTLDKKQGSFNQATTTSAVKQDLIISAYKPRADFERQFELEAGTEEGVWNFVRQHLEKLPVVVHEKGVIQVIAERQNFLLFSRMVAFHIQRDAKVPISAPEFYRGLDEKFIERDGMYFLPTQAAEYDKIRAKTSNVQQLELFVTDEGSAVQWLRSQLEKQPQTYQELSPNFLRELQKAKHEELPELRTMLEENFLCDKEGCWYVPDPDSQEDLEKLRSRRLWDEFQEYAQGKGKLRTFRTEAIRAGFKRCYAEQQWNVIVDVGDRMPQDVLYEDQDLLMYYDIATTRMDEEPMQGELL